MEKIARKCHFFMQLCSIVLVVMNPKAENPSAERRAPSAEKGQNVWFSLQKKQKCRAPSAGSRAPIFSEQADFRGFHYH
jgi:hypothetical protein